MRAVTTLLILVALGLSVYNALELRSIRAELVAVRAGASARPAPDDAKARAHELLRQAEQHSARANELMRKGKPDAALAEMQQSADLIAEAKRGGADGDTIARIRGRLEEMLARGKEKLRPASR